MLLYKFVFLVIFFETAYCSLDTRQPALQVESQTCLTECGRYTNNPQTGHGYTCGKACMCAPQGRPKLESCVNCINSHGQAGSQIPVLRGVSSDGIDEFCSKFENVVNSGCHRLLGYDALALLFAFGSFVLFTVHML